MKPRRQHLSLEPHEWGVKAMGLLFYFPFCSIYLMYEYNTTGSPVVDKPLNEHNNTIQV